MKHLITLIIAASLALTMQAQNSITNTVAAGDSFIIEDAANGQLFETYYNIVNNGSNAKFEGDVNILGQISVSGESFFVEQVFMTQLATGGGATGDLPLYVNASGEVKTGTAVLPSKSVSNEIQQLKEENAALKTEMAELRKMVEELIKK